MKVKSAGLILCALVFGGVVLAGDRSGGGYEVQADSTDAGGRRTTSAVYTNYGSVGGIVGLSTSTPVSETVKAGYIGQLFEFVGVQLGATPATVDEGDARQLSAVLLLDDRTRIAVAAEAIAWSVQSGPIDAISAGGLASAGVVFRDTGAMVRGDYGGGSGTLNLTVLDLLADNFGSYAGDGLDDGWQVQYFGEENPLAGPGVDADGDEHDNCFEFAAGLDPTDPLSYFAQRLVPGELGQTRLVFSPRLADRTYTVKASVDLLSPVWATLAGSTFTDDGDERTVIDTDVSAVRKFYKIEILRP